MIYKLKKGEHIAVTGDESKRDQFMKLGFVLQKEPKKKEKE